MEATSTAIPLRKSNACRAILWAGLIAGALDITAACARWALRGVSPARVLRGVAGGLLGPSAAQGGTATAALGLLLHFVIAFGAAAVYFAASRKIDFLVRRPWIAGPLYGIAVHGFMQFVVLPLSALRMGPFSPSEFLIGLIIHVLFVGLPIAFTISRFSR
ncbi:MAG TPA: hypothetical protein VL025_16660 [Thermoanaerobaculia bacterium]|nr:hypothetical protein [Thermoanaerobaculia bacterium]